MEKIHYRVNQTSDNQWELLISFNETHWWEVCSWDEKPTIMEIKNQQCIIETTLKAFCATIKTQKPITGNITYDCRY